MLAFILGISAEKWAMIGSISAALAAIGAMITALVNHRQSRTSTQMHEAQLYMGFSQRYGSPDMTQALSDLIEWKNTYGDTFVDVFISCIKQREQHALRINIQRRILDRYYSDVARAYSAQVLNKKFVTLAADHNGAAVWKKIAIPMSLALFDETENASLKVLEEIVPSFGERHSILV